MSDAIDKNAPSAPSSALHCVSKPITANHIYSPPPSTLLLPFPFLLSPFRAGNSHGKYRDPPTSGFIGMNLVNAICRASEGGPKHGDGLKHSLQTLTLAWVGMSAEAMTKLTKCLFGGKSGKGGVGEEEAGQGFSFAFELNHATISSPASALRRDQHNFPAFEAFGLIQQSNKPGGSDFPISFLFLKRLLRSCLARGITDIDLSRNGLGSDKVVELIKVIGRSCCNSPSALSHFASSPSLPSPLFKPKTVPELGSHHRPPSARSALRPEGTFGRLVTSSSRPFLFSSSIPQPSFPLTWMSKVAVSNTASKSL
jgi:hypothetical protein